MFVIKRIDGKFVAPSGSKLSYTDDLQDARKYHTRKEAEADLCPENERVFDIHDILWP
jgi:hypothetical protein